MKKGSGIYSAGASGAGTAPSSGFSSSKFKVSKPPSSLILYSFAFVKFASNSVICFTVLAICSSKFFFNCVKRVAYVTLFLLMTKFKKYI